MNQNDRLMAENWHLGDPLRRHRFDRRDAAWLGGALAFVVAVLVFVGVTQ